MASREDPKFFHIIGLVLQHRVPEQFASVIVLSSPGLVGAEETYTDEEALCPVSSRQQEKNCITSAYLLHQQFSGQKLLSSAGRNDLWSRTSGLRKWSCSFYLGKPSPEILSGSILLWFLPSKFKLLCPASCVVTSLSCQLSILWVFIKIMGNSWLGPTFSKVILWGHILPFLTRGLCADNFLDLANRRKHTSLSLIICYLKLWSVPQNISSEGCLGIPSQVSLRVLSSGTAQRMFMQNSIPGLHIRLLMSMDF